MIQNGSKSSNGSGKSKNGKIKSGSEDATDSSSKKKKSGIQPWMLIAPKDGEPKVMMKNEKAYNWCPKCANGAGQWVRHEPADHSDGFKSKKKSSENSRSKDDSSKKQSKKNSSASGDSSAGNPNSSGKGGNLLRFNRASLLSMAAGNNSDTQAFLSQFVPGND